MRTISFKLLICFLMLWLPYLKITASAQEWETEPSTSNESGTDPFGGDPFGGMINQGNNEEQWEVQDSQESQPGAATEAEPAPASPEQAPSYTQPENSAPSTDDSYGDEESIQESVVQNAIIEGVQLTTEQGETPDEKLISGYFIFRDKPSSYFWEIKPREKKMVFEFHDTKTGSSPVPSVSEAPIRGFKIEEGKIDINKDVRGLKPEYRDIIKVIFDLEAVPEIHVNDEFSIVSFSFKWTTDPTKIDKYVVKDNTKKIILLSSAGVGAVGLGALVYYLATKPPPPAPDGPIDISDLPQHKINRMLK